MLDLSNVYSEISSLPAPCRFSDLFGDDRPVEFEVGPGKGLFLVNEAARHADRGYFGVEYARKYAKLAAERVAKRDLSNVKVVHGDAFHCLARHVADVSLAAVHIYFPDPWWKKRHKKRRVFREAFVVEVARALKPGGDFRLATDVEEYFGAMMEILAAHPEFLPLAPPEPNTPEHDLDYLTNFERKYRIEGRSIFRASYRLRDDWIAPAKVERQVDTLS